MADNFKQALRKTTRQFGEYIVPVAPMMMSGQLMPVEGKTDDELADLLDKLAGTDIIGVDHGMMFGVASRIQTMPPGRDPWNTFTVRKRRDSGVPTEYEKRIAAIESGYFYPRITYQAYVSADTGGRLLSMAVCLTSELMGFCQSGKARTRHTGRDQIGGAEFFVCPWRDMVRHGCHMRVLDGDGRIFECSGGVARESKRGT